MSWSKLDKNLDRVVIMAFFAMTTTCTLLMLGAGRVDPARPFKRLRRMSVMANTDERARTTVRHYNGARGTDQEQEIADRLAALPQRHPVGSLMRVGARDWHVEAITFDVNGAVIFDLVEPDDEYESITDSDFEEDSD